MSINLLGIGEIVTGVGKVADDLFTSDEERLKIALLEKQIEADLVNSQLEVNKAEAAHPSIFVAGWRPAIGWIGAAAMAYQFLLYPLMTWGWTFFQAKGWVPPDLLPPPVLDAQELWVILTGMLGIAGLRSFDKLQGTQTQRMAGKAGPAERS
jgi:Holin of 3TMs, for gene-transfer release